MTLTLIVGAACGLGLFLIIRALLPSRPSAAAIVTHVDLLRARTTVTTTVAPPADRAAKATALRDRIEVLTADLFARQGWQLTSLRSDLAILERSVEQLLATKVLLATVGILFGPALFAALWVLGLAPSPLVPVWLALLGMAVCFFLPDLEIKRDAKEKRADFRRVLGVYLDLVAMNLAGGRGLPEALMAAADISSSWPLQRISRCLGEARLTGVSQWSALGRLGDEIDVPELKDLAAALALVADDGAKVRLSLAARAETMRARELAELEGAAAAQSQSMLVAQLLLGLGFLIFLAYPALTRVTAL